MKRNLAEKYRYRRRTINESVHVSDILPSSILRKQYYSRVILDERERQEGQEQREELIDDFAVHSFVRGDASEHIITALANMGVAQASIEMDGIKAHPDIMIKNKLVVELKNTAGNRLTLNDSTFQAYLLLLLYYVAMTEIETGILAIRYEIKDLTWIGRDEQGDHYVRALDVKPPTMDCFRIILSLHDPMRDAINLDSRSRDMTKGFLI